MIIAVIGMSPVTTSGRGYSMWPRLQHADAHLRHVPTDVGYEGGRELFQWVRMFYVHPEFQDISSVLHHTFLDMSLSLVHVILIWLVLWNMPFISFMTFHILGMSWSQVTFTPSFFRVGEKPPTRSNQYIQRTPPCRARAKERANNSRWTMPWRWRTRRSRAGWLDDENMAIWPTHKDVFDKLYLVIWSCFDHFLIISMLI